MPHDTTITAAAASDAAPHSEDLRSLEAGLDRLQMTTDRPTSQ